LIGVGPGDRLMDRTTTARGGEHACWSAHGWG
jgi:hypothetical protein